jgi:hypothetical protein
MTRNFHLSWYEPLRIEYSGNFAPYVHRRVSTSSHRQIPCNHPTLAFADRVKTELPRLDVLINNAGINSPEWKV